MYYIYHIPGVKIGCTKNLKSRIRVQGFTEYEVLEEHYDINIASNRERQLQRKYGYQVDNGSNVYSDKFAGMGKKGGGKNTKKQMEWRKKWGTDKATETINSGKWAELQKKGREVSTKKRIESGRWDKIRIKGTEAASLVTRKKVEVYDKLNNFIKEYNSATEAAIDLCIGCSTISNTIAGRNNHSKYNFKYK
jgi:hypothetical protein